LQPFVSAAAIAIENAQLHESARQEIARREQAERALRQAYDQLESQIQAGTYDLANANNVLQAQVTERERIERALRESEELYRAAVQQSNDAIYLLDEKNLILVNQAFERTFGYSSAEVAPPEFELINLVAPEHRPMMMARTEVYQSGQIPISRYEFQALKKNGQTFEAEVNITQIELGGRTLRQGILRDITERKQALQALHESEERFRSAFNNTPIGMAILDLDGRCIQVNSAMCQILGYTEAEIKTLDFRQLAIPGEHDTVVHYWQQIRQGALDAYRQEGQYLHKAGHIVWALTSASAVHDDRGQPLHVIVQLNDITSRIQAEENLEQLLETLQQRNRQLITAAEVSKWASANLDQQTLIERVVDLIRDGFNFYYVGLFLCDEAREFAVLRAGTGEAGRRMLTAGHKLDIGGESMIGQCVRHAHPRIALKAREEPIRFDNPLLPGTRSEMALPLNTLTGGIGARTVHSAQEAAFTEEDVTILQSMVDQVAIAIENARLYRAAQDEIVRRQAIEAEIIQLNESLERRVRERTAELEAANRELETFSYSVSHDLRAPLRSINGFSQALLEDYGDQLPLDGQDYLKRVRAASQRMSQLIDDILDLSRVTRAEMQRETVSLSTLAQAIAAELHANQPERQAEFAIQPGLEAYADPQLLQIVLENLLGNAWKFTSKHAQARIEFGQTRVDGVPAYFVRDDGAGFDKTYASKMFMPFQRLHAVTEFEGNGIGLATVQRIIHRHGGRVWAEGAVERGATFYFTLI
jgi:PAS domain S-box-containing protein